MAGSPARKEAKADRVELRASSRQTAVIRRAAEATGKSMSAFMLDASTMEAERALADRNVFRLDAEAWERFVEALDRRAKPHPRLRRLMTEPSVLD
ncbi:MAG: DUF1778 domain-containing protein [Actinomycetota bacterium]